MLAASFNAWLGDWTFGVTLLLTAGWLAMLLSRNPVWRKAIARWTFAACLCVGILMSLPGLPRYSVAPIHTSLPSEPVADILHSDAASQSPQHPFPRHDARQSVFASLHFGIDTATRIALSLYYILAGLMAIRLICGLFLARYYVRMSREAPAPVQALFESLCASRTVSLRISPSLGRPVTTGFIRSTILIPEYLCIPERRPELEAVLLHELAHARAGDTAILLSASILKVFAYFHPLFWLILRNLQLSQELLADAWAAKKIGSTALYVERFMQLAQMTNPLVGWIVPAVQAIRKRSEFYLRMNHLLHQNIDAVHRPCRKQIAAFVVLLTAMAGLCTAFTLNCPPANHEEGKVTRTEIQSASSAAAEERGLLFLQRSQQPDGGWLSSTGPGVTALAVRALLESGRSTQNPDIKRAMDFIESTHQSDGGYYLSSNPTYSTALVVGLLASFPDDRFHDSVQRAHRFLAAMEKPQNPPGSFY